MGYSPWGHKESDTTGRLARQRHGLAASASLVEDVLLQGQATPDTPWACLPTWTFLPCYVALCKSLNISEPWFSLP